MRLAAAAFAACAVCVPFGRAHAATLTLADLRKTVSLSSPQIAPDGTRVAVLVGRRDFTKNKETNDLVLIDVRTRAARTLLHAMQVSSFAWSPSGDAIAFVGAASDDAKPQLFLLPMNGGEPVALSAIKNGVSALAWRPDGRGLAFAANGEAPNAKAIEAHDDAFNVTDEAWTAQAAPVPDQLYEVSVAGGTPHRVTAWRWNVAGRMTYSEDGRSLFVTRTKPNAHPNRYLATEIVRVRLRDGSVVPIGALSSTQSDPLRSPDGRYIAFTFGNPAGTMQSEAALADPMGLHPRFLTRALDRDVDIADFDRGDDLVIAANDKTQARLFRVAPDGGVTRYPIGPVTAFEASVARNGTIVFTGVTPGRPTELYALSPHGGTPQRLTHYNDWIEHFALGKQQTIVWHSGTFLPDGVLTYPPNWHRGTRAPLVLLIHGGPTGASNVGFYGFAQVLAAHGWFVFSPNYRGSDNLGIAFARTTVPHIASVPGIDIERGLAAVLALGVVDPARIGVSGWSEGGLMTSWLIGHDTRWKAAVSGAAVNDWIGYDAMTDAKDFTDQFIGASPWADPAMKSLYESESPLAYAANVRTPTLILSDAGDFRVPTPLSYEFYHDVRATGTKVQFVIYPVTGHFPSDPVRVEDVYRRWEAWLLNYL